MNSRSSQVSGSVIIGGLRSHMIKIGFAFTAALIAFRMILNPLILYQACKHLLTLRRKIYDGQKLRKLAKADGLYYSSINVPGWPSKAFNSFVRREITAFLNPAIPTAHQSIFFAITSRCPLNCSHCYEWDNMNSGEKLSYADLETILEKIEDQGIRHIHLSGGEPLSRFDDLIRLMRKARYPIDFWLLTSGFGLDDEKARQLKQAGLTGACISLDHWDEPAHNAFRNSSKSFEWARQAAKSCQLHGIVVSFGICVMKDFITIENLERYYQLCKSWGASFIRILEPRTVGKFSDHKIELSPADIQILEGFYLESQTDFKWKKYPIVQYPGYIQRRFGCLGSGNRYLYIDSHGMFKPCPFCDHSYGSALTVPFGQAIHEMHKIGCHNN